MLSKFVLESLDQSRLIALCVYFDIEWRIKCIDINSPNNIYFTTSKIHLVKSILDFINHSKFNFTFYFFDNTRHQLFPQSLVLFKQFSSYNPFCVIICNQLNIILDSTTFKIVHYLWIYHNKPFNYLFLAKFYKAYKHKFTNNLCISEYAKNRAIFKYNEFINYI